MSGPVSRLTKTLATITKRMKWPDNKSVGYARPDSRDKFLNPLLTPPDRSPRSADDFRYPSRLGHWYSLGYDFTSPQADKYYFNESIAILMCCWIVGTFIYMYGPDYKQQEWARREAFLRTHKREALGLPLIDKNVVDPERVCLPTEEELAELPDDFEIQF